jgi:hypothetical protein
VPHERLLVLYRCYLECDTCVKQCTSPLARTLNTLYKCSIGLPVVGINVAARISDQGTDAMKRHGAIRRQGRKPTPESVYPEIHSTLINNDIAYPRVARNSISCRKAHRESIYGRYQPPLDDEGNTRQREGFHVRCLARTTPFLVVHSGRVRLA